MGSIYLRKMSRGTSPAWQSREIISSARCLSSRRIAKTRQPQRLRSNESSSLWECPCAWERMAPGERRRAADKFARPKWTAASKVLRGVKIARSLPCYSLDVFCSNRCTFNLLGRGERVMRLIELGWVEFQRLGGVAVEVFEAYSCGARFHWSIKNYLLNRIKLGGCAIRDAKGSHVLR